jgi:hypothetical protein
MVGECTVEDGADLNEIGDSQPREGRSVALEKEGGRGGKEIDRLVERQGKVVLEFDFEHGEENSL